MPARLRRAEATAAALRTEIETGRYRPGDRLPAEPELAGRLGVSRPTLREAFRLLHDEGLVRREHGSGTYVRERPAVRNNLERNFGVTALIEAFGRVPGVAERSEAVEAADAEVAAALGVQPGAPIATLRRVRTADGRRIIASVDRCRPEVLGDDGWPEEGSLYAALARRGVAIHHGVATVRPEQAGPELAARLAVAPGTLLLALDQLDFTDRDEPVLLSHEHHLADAFEWTIHRRGPGEAE
jgi:GntR family transcriptional regulator